MTSQRRRSYLSVLGSRVGLIRSEPWSHVGGLTSTHHLHPLVRVVNGAGTLWSGAWESDAWKAVNLPAWKRWCRRGWPCLLNSRSPAVGPCVRALHGMNCVDIGLSIRNRMYSPPPFHIPSSRTVIFLHNKAPPQSVRRAARIWRPRTALAPLFALKCLAMAAPDRSRFPKAIRPSFIMSVIADAIWS